MLQYFSFVKHANTPLKRMGLLLLAASLLYWSGMAIYWNVNKHGFIYSYWDTWTEEAPRPQDDEKITWQRGTEILDAFVPSKGFLLDERKPRYGWVSYNRSCLKKESKPMTFLDPYPLKCRGDFIPDEIKSKLIHSQSFIAFIDNLFSTYSDGHFKLSMFFLFLTVLGFMMFIGTVDKLLRWINTGKIR